MAHPYTRPLHTLPLIEGFLETVLESTKVNESELINLIIDNELRSIVYDKNAFTINSLDFRDKNFRDDKKRWELRLQIVYELFSLNRLNDDDDITLKNGGAKPNTEIKKEGQAYIITGLPASGKSGVAAKVADGYGAVILDSDFAKRKFPEYICNTAAASLLHEEADSVIFGFNGGPPFPSLLELCAKENYNIVIPKIGHKAESIAKLAIALKKQYGYKDVHLTLVGLDKKKATNRAIERFYETKRYVPLSLIFDGYGNEPTLSYYRLREPFPKFFKGKDYSNIFTSFGKLSNDVDKGSPPSCIHHQSKNPTELYSIKK